MQLQWHLALLSLKRVCFISFTSYLLILHILLLTGFLFTSAASGADGNSADAAAVSSAEPATLEIGGGGWLFEDYCVSVPKFVMYVAGMVVERSIERQINLVEGAIVKVEQKIEGVEKELETATGEDRAYLRKKEEQLRKKEEQLRREKEQLRKKEEQLREERAREQGV